MHVVIPRSCYMAQPISTALAANFATCTARVDDTGGKFAKVVKIPAANLPGWCQ
jgi:hypothetical protein